MAASTARADQGATVPATSQDIASLGLTGVFTNLSAPRECLPRINMTNFGQGGGGTNAYTASNQPMWDMSDAVSWVKGRHSVNFGFNYRHW